MKERSNIDLAKCDSDSVEHEYIFEWMLQAVVAKQVFESAHEIMCYAFFRTDDYEILKTEP